MFHSKHCIAFFEGLLFSSSVPNLHLIQVDNYIFYNSTLFESNLSFDLFRKRKGEILLLVIFITPPFAFDSDSSFVDGTFKTFRWQLFCLEICLCQGKGNFRLLDFSFKANLLVLITWPSVLQYPLVILNFSFLNEFDSFEFHFLLLTILFKIAMPSLLFRMM